MNSHTAVLHGVAEFACGYEIDRHVVFHDFDAWVGSDLRDERVFDFAPSGVPEMEDAALGVSAFTTEVELVVSIAVFPLVELHTKIHELRDAFRTLGDDFSDCILMAQARSRIERVSDMEFKRILIAHHASDASLCPRGV